MIAATADSDKRLPKFPDNHMCGLIIVNELDSASQLLPVIQWYLTSNIRRYTFQESRIAEIEGTFIK